MPTPSENPFTPPQARVADAPDITPGSPVKAVLLGLAVDFGGTATVTLLIGTAYVVFLLSAGMPRSEIAAAFEMPLNSWRFIAITSLGYGFSVLGGYVCARIAKRSEYVLGAIVGTVSSILGFLMSVQTFSVSLNALFSLLALAFVMLGTKLGRLRNRRS